MTTSKKLQVVVAGRSERVLKPLTDALGGASDIACSTYVIDHRRTDALLALEPVPDVIVLRFDADDLDQLAALAEPGVERRSPIVVVGPAGNAEAVRLAVRSGARDFLAEPVNPAELVAAVQALRNDVAHNHAGQKAEVITVLGAAGGVGTSLVACNLALAYATATQAPTLLLDLDVHAAPLAGFLDLSPERGLPAALAEVEYLDGDALPGYVAKHKSGLRLLGTPSSGLVPARDLDPARFATLVGVLTSNFRYIVADAAHTLDELSVATLGMSRHVVLVVQQSVLQLRQAARTLGVICNEIGLPRDRVIVVVNRYLKYSTVALDDIRRALGHEHLTVLPSHYKPVLTSIDSGMPLVEHDRSSAIARGIIELQREIASGRHIERHSLLRRALPIFSGD